MPSYPTLHDDGQTVTLDLHGASVDEAVELARRTLAEAAQRGRRQVKIIHGGSTSSVAYRNRTIKHRLYALLDHGPLPAAVTDTWRAEDYVLLALNLAAASDSRRLRLSDVLGGPAW